MEDCLPRKLSHSNQIEQVTFENYYLLPNILRQSEYGASRFDEFENWIQVRGVSVTVGETRPEDTHAG